jgi:c-di-GMP-binding flagellar brake protein YcgR
MLDISAGGLKLRIAEQLKVRDKIKLKIFINKEELTIKGEIVRVIEEQDKRYACGVRFIDLEEQTREKIIKFVFQLMREKRKNG